jgi:hypothetical protein
MICRVIYTRCLSKVNVIMITIKDMFFFWGGEGGERKQSFRYRSIQKNAIHKAGITEKPNWTCDRFHSFPRICDHFFKKKEYMTEIHRKSYGE